MQYRCKLALMGLIVAGFARTCPAQVSNVTCETCHAREAAQLSRSIHTSLACRDCHQGPASYAISPDDIRTYATTSARSRPMFDHGVTFAGKPSRKSIPELCGTCHADVERMNPYGLRTDQLTRY